MRDLGDKNATGKQLTIAGSLLRSMPQPHMSYTSIAAAAENQHCSGTVPLGHVDTGCGAAEFGHVTKVVASFDVKV